MLWKSVSVSWEACDSLCGTCVDLDVTCSQQWVLHCLYDAFHPKSSSSSTSTMLSLQISTPAVSSSFEVLAFSPYSAHLVVIIHF